MANPAPDGGRTKTPSRLSMTEAELAVAVTGAARPLEGWLFPETYHYTRVETLTLSFLNKPIRPCETS